MKKLMLFVCLMCGLATAYGQEMSVQSFYLAETDLTANTPGTMREDQNGDLCALIKVETSHDGFSFDPGQLGVRGDIERVGGELWVYLPYGVKKVTISHAKLGVIRDYKLPVSLSPGRTYIMKLNASLPTEVAFDSSKKQNVSILITPAHAKLELNGISLSSGKDGVFEEELAYGIHTLTVSADMYHKQSHRIEINDATKNKTFEFRLKQAYGWLQVSCSGDETLYLDGNQVPMSADGRADVASGHYKVMVKKPLYKPYETTVEVKDSAVTYIRPEFAVNHRVQEFKVAEPVGIWIDGKYVTTGRSWSGKLEYGTHVIHCKKDNHRQSELVLNVTPEPMGPVTLSLPEPIYGTLMITTTPAGAEVYVDDVLAGHTPAALPVLIGKREVSVRKAGYNTENMTVTIKEAETLQTDVNLNNIVPVTIKSNPNASLSINGKDVGKTKWTGNLTAGEYTVSLQAPKYMPFEKKIKVDQRHSEFTFNMKRKYYYEDNMVLSANVNDVSLGGFLGVYLGNVYFEGNYNFGTSSERIYWNQATTNTPVPYSYKSVIIGGKFGYGLTLGNRMRLTPLAGVSCVNLDGTLEEYISLGFDPSACSAFAVNGGLRLSYALTSFLEFNVTPEYWCPVHKSDIYSALYEVSPVIRNWTEGVRLNFGIGIFL